MDDVKTKIILERAQPKKPLGEYYQARWCPTCKVRIPSGEGSSRGASRANVCNNCFQVIDWTDCRKPTWGNKTPIGFNEIKAKQISYARLDGQLPIRKKNK